MLRKILIVLAVLIVALVVIIATRPGSFRVVRSATMAAPAAVVYAQIADFHRWDAWSPWAKLDPSMKVSFSGPASGPGAGYAWVGNDKVGEGKMLITGARPGQEVDIQLDFLKPWQATNATTFVLEPAGPGTKVTWSMSGESNFMAKAMSLVMDMDAMIGKDFEKGLSQMGTVAAAETKRLADEAAKKAAEAAAAQAAADAAAAQAAAAAKPAKPAKGAKK
ncbi:MAG TPA: SRPBCC family protein [Myxococcaceae bacterium]|nr:SRPBCC family protein [Myxococcaceae bacterium]